MRARFVRFVTILWALSAGAGAGAAVAAPPVVVRAGTLIDGSGAAPRRNVEILVQDGRFVRIGTTVDAPADAVILDLSGQTVLPGFIDCHVHLAGEMTGDWTNRGVRQLPAEAAAIATAYAHRTLDAGFTTVRNWVRPTMSTSGCATPSTKDSWPGRAWWSPPTPSAAPAAMQTQTASGPTSSTMNRIIATGS